MQLKRRIHGQFKTNPTKSIMGLFTISIFLLLISFIVKEFLSPIIEIIYFESNKTAEIYFFRSINLTVSVISSLVLILSVFMGMQEQKEFDKMMQNYQISQFTRNTVHFIFEFISNLALVLILISVLILPSVRTQEIKLLSVYVMLFSQSTLTILFLLCLERIIRVLMPKIFWQISLIFIQGYYYFKVYRNLDSWHLTNYFNFIVGDEFKYFYIPVFIFLLLLYILNFKAYKESFSHRFIRFRFLPNNHIFKSFKELIRNKENTLNSFILLFSIFMLKIFKPDILEEETVRMALISLTGMQSIYLFSYFKESLILYRFTYQSSLKIYSTYMIALLLANLLQFIYISFFIPGLLEQIGTIGVTLVLVNSVFICLGKFFPLQEKYGFNTSFQLALIVLMIVPLVIILFEIKKQLDLSNYEFLYLQAFIAFVIQVIVIRSVNRDLAL